MDIMQNSVTFFSTLEINYTNFKTGPNKNKKIDSALFCLLESLFGNKIVLCTLGAPQGARTQGSQSEGASEDF